ncbi:MAG: sigma-70 family RNA polymerase sigma factor [Planctomycetes bacterium]|nr:sigma-70 family RNA polymerase sigma factor [Planctomycetota bacterium]
MSVSTDLFEDYTRGPEPAALDRLLERHREAVYSLCVRVLRHPQDAEDACQEVLLEVSRQAGAIEEPGRFAGWLYRTALHTALDLKRKRGRQRRREAAAGPPAESDPAAVEAQEALHRGLAGLDEASRMLVVEHYLARRPLRELAEERGCSAVAVWKRIRQARERLRRVIGPAAMTALEVPSGFLRGFLIQGGLAMTAKTAIQLAIVAPLVLLAAAGTVVWVRRSEPFPAPAQAARASTVQLKSIAAEPATAMAGAAPSRVEERGGAAATPRASRRPYPFKLPVPGAPAGAVNTWTLLSSKRLTLDHQNLGLPEILEDIGKKLGLPVLVESGHDQERISMKVHDIVADGCLRLLLSPREFDYEIRPDGSLYVAPQGALEQGYAREARDRIARRAELDGVREELERGWDGLQPQAGPGETTKAALGTRTIATRQGETCVDAELRRLREEFELQVCVHDPVDREGFALRQEALNRPYLQVVEEHNLGDYVNRLAGRLGLTAFVSESGMISLISETWAARYRAEAEQKRQVRERSVASLDLPLEVGGSVVPQEFLDSLQRSHELNVVPGEAVWNSEALLTLPAGTTLRQGLDQLRTLGFRWALRDGKLYVLK